MREKLDHLKKVSTALDSQFQGPFGLRFGWDAIIGLIPGVGDAITTGFSFYILAHAALMGCKPSTLLRMGMNVLMENVIDIVPFLGNVFDFFWKANNKNIQILESHFASPRETTIQSRILVGLVFLFLVGLLVAIVAAAVFLFKIVIAAFN